MTTDSSGGVVSAQTYFAFGAVRSVDHNPAVTDYGFTGQKFDSGDALMYYGARYYDSQLGRFIQPDSIVPNPFNPQTLNRYSYVYNNPVRYTDPTGHMPPTGPCPDGICEPPDQPPSCGDPVSCGPPPSPSQPSLPAEGSPLPCGAPDADPQNCTGPKAGTEQTKDPLGSNATASKSLPTPPSWCPLGKFCQRPSSVVGVGTQLPSFFHWAPGGGFDLVFDWETSQIGLFGWNITNNGHAFMTPSASLIDIHSGPMWGMVDINSYAGDMDVSGVTVVAGSLNYSQSTNGGPLQGVTIGVGKGAPPVEGHYYQTHTDRIGTWDIYRPIMNILSNAMGVPMWGK
ncbi:MAG: RHS repeat-associated core domain-containing protein [Anaerolineae bacterium]